ncbi:MAG: signal recognition particle protein [Candidatus Diapherotrites archaeon]|nr:signal recognition particle protein [Candidatus Diapherotrites archaeon]
MSLGERLRKAMEAVQNLRVVDKDAIKEIVKEIQRALISADVEVNLVLELSRRIEREAFKEDLPKGLTRREHLATITYEYLAELLGGTPKIPENPQRILLVGLFGSGKSTAIGKLANYYKKRGLKIGVIAGDTFRAGAVDQLKQVTAKVEGTEFFSTPNEKNAAKVIRAGLQELEKKKVNLILCDSAGRSALDEELVKEIKELHNAFKPHHTWLVLGADIGQLAKRQAQAFHEAVGVNGVIITRTDGSAKGGGALAACHTTNAPVYFLGTGEKVSDLEEFDAPRFLGKIMGYGDLQSLLEKARELEEENETDLEEMLEHGFNLHVFYEQLKAARKMGPLNKVAEMMGLNMQIPKEQLEIGEEKLDHYKHIMDSMTKKEKLNPDLITRSRIERISRGSGRTEEEVRELLKHYKQLAKVYDKFKNINLEKMQSAKGMQKLMQGFQKRKKKKLRLK